MRVPEWVRGAPAAVVAAVLLTGASAGCHAGPAPATSPAPLASDTAPPRSGVVTASQWRGQPAVSVDELLRGRVPGLQLSGPPGSMSMQIRGATSFRGSTEPLIVVDGMPMRRGAGALAFVAPADVSRIEVLRRPEELAPYGMQGANGVVLITTRRR